ncbi:MAG: ATP-dependent RNA helicase HrpA [Fibrobacteria bacterium]|nr:ATP-dependent RNA helicase HrpA [Fibrobacteria bacterium]
MNKPLPDPHFDIPTSRLWGPDISRLRRLRHQALKGQQQSAENFYSLLDKSLKTVTQRQQRTLIFGFPSLPILSAREEIEQALEEHQVILVSAGTGSGKSTQLPKFCVDMGRSITGRVGITQPRRLAAHTVAARLEEETGNNQIVGCQTRFHKQVAPGADIKVMTDGILLQECRKDPFLNEYQVIIIDEVHERSLNIDVILGLLHRLRARRKDLKIILSSATMETEALSAFFDNAPVISAEGRNYPVRIEYCNPGEAAGAFASPIEHMGSVITGLLRTGPDHLLAFLPTEHDILELKGELERQLDEKYAILPLFSRLPAAEQKKIFSPGNKIKVVLATNIAETSLTIPGVAYVVDMGLARISRYFPHTRVQGLPIEPISQASADQRAGRAGRTRPGLCVRLYEQKDYENRFAFTEPEIKRSNLSNVALQLLALGIKNLESFPLPSPPKPGQFKTALNVLRDLGALHESDNGYRLSQEGYRLSTIALDVALAKMLLTAKKLGVLTYALPVIAAVSLQDPRIVPTEAMEKSKAKGLHSRFSHNKSDALSLLNLYVWLMQQWQEIGGSINRLRKLCLQNYLHFLRVREWMDLIRQLSREWKVAVEVSLIPKEKNELLHKALLSGLPAHVACLEVESRSYRVAGGKEAIIFPGSCLKRSRPPWIGAIQLRETSRLFLADAFVINPEWIENFWPHRCKKQYFQAGYNTKTGYVEARETISYLGLALPQVRRVQYQRINPEEAAEIFWREAVVGEKMSKAPGFHRQNLSLLEDLKQAESALRQTLGLPEEEELTSHYLKRAPEVCSDKNLQAWLAQYDSRKLLLEKDEYLGDSLKERNALIRVSANKSVPFEKLYPDNLEVFGYGVRVYYRWQEAGSDDGVHIHPGHSALLAAVDPLFWWKMLPAVTWNCLEAIIEKNKNSADWEKLIPNLLHYVSGALDRYSDSESMYTKKVGNQRSLLPAFEKYGEKDVVGDGALDNGLCDVYPSLAGLVLDALKEANVSLRRPLEWPRVWPKKSVLHIHYTSLQNKKKELEITPDCSSADYWQKCASLSIDVKAHNAMLLSAVYKSYGGIKVNWMRHLQDGHGKEIPDIIIHPLEEKWAIAQNQYRKAGRKKVRKRSTKGKNEVQDRLWTEVSAQLSGVHREYLQPAWNGLRKTWGPIEIPVGLSDLLKKKDAKVVGPPVEHNVSRVKSFRELSRFTSPENDQEPAYSHSGVLILLGWSMSWGPRVFEQAWKKIDSCSNNDLSFVELAENYGSIVQQIKRPNNMAWALAAYGWATEKYTPHEVIDIWYRTQNMRDELTELFPRYCDYPSWHQFKKTVCWKAHEVYFNKVRECWCDKHISLYEKINVHLGCLINILQCRFMYKLKNLNDTSGHRISPDSKPSIEALQHLCDKFGSIGK